MIKTVAIVGAGFAGLSTARVLRSWGFDVTVFEKEPDVGGVWARSRRYPGLTTQNPRGQYALSDFPMPESYPEWPTGEQVQRYLQSYAEHFDLSSCVSLSTEVTRAVFEPERSRWRVCTRRTVCQGESKATTREYDYLVVCNGIFSRPLLPSYRGERAFIEAGGLLCHTSELNDAALARGKHVLVIGYGKSSCDVAAAIADQSASTTVVARELIWKVPKQLADLLNFKFLLLTRMGEALFEYIELKGIERFLHGVGKGVRNALLRSVQSVITRQLELEQLGLVPDGPFENIARSTVSLTSDGFFERVAAGKLRVIRGQEIRELRPGYATLSDGSEMRADVIVCGTGWRQEVPFLGQELVDRITDEAGNFCLYRSILPLEVPRLAFNGYNSSFFSQLNCEVGAHWLARHMRAQLRLPSVSARARMVAERLAWMEERTQGKHAKGTNIIPFSLHHIDELMADMGETLGAWSRLKQWFLPIEPSDYAFLHTRAPHQVIPPRAPLASVARFEVAAE